MADTEAYIPNVYEEVEGVVDITTLNSRQYCVVLDPVGADGKPQLGQKKVVKVTRRWRMFPRIPTNPIPYEAQPGGYTKMSPPRRPRPGVTFVSVFCRGRSPSSCSPGKAWRRESKTFTSCLRRKVWC